MNDVTVQLGEKVISFESHQQWVSKARQWYGCCHYPSGMLLAIDSKGRLCGMGKHFALARDDDGFPVSVYVMWPQEELPKAKKGEAQ